MHKKSCGNLCVFLFLFGIWRLILCLWFVIWNWSHGRHILLIYQLIWRSIMPQSLFWTKWLIGLSSLSDGPLICSFRYGRFILPFFPSVIFIKSIVCFFFRVLIFRFHKLWLRMFLWIDKLWKTFFCWQKLYDYPWKYCCWTLNFDFCVGFWGNTGC